LLYALSLVGTPYKPGGSDPAKGTDCSGYVRHVYKKTAGIELPHNAKQMSQRGETIGKDQLKPGDLVFFNTLKRPFSHVGIYAGDGRFVHSTSSKTKVSSRRSCVRKVRKVIGFNQ
jgi:cell wall-associated NlpC family hydrolase